MADEFEDAGIVPHDPYADLNTKLGAMNRTAFGPLAGPTHNLMGESGLHTGVVVVPGGGGAAPPTLGATLEGAPAKPPIAPTPEPIPLGGTLQGQAPPIERPAPTAPPLEAEPVPGDAFKPVSAFEQAAMARSAAHEHERISTRLPSPANQPPDMHSRGDMNVDYQTAISKPETLANVAKVIRDYGGHQIPGGLSDADTVEAYVNHLKDNVLAIHDNIPPEIREWSKLWYAGANQTVHDFAQQYGVEPRQAAAVIAAQSPRKDWFMNRELGRRVLDINQNQQDTVMTPEMHDWANGYMARLAPGSASLAKAQDFMANAAHLPFGQMQNPADRAHFIRFYDEAHNPDKSFQAVTPDGREIGKVLNKGPDEGTPGDPTTLVWGGMNSIAKAASVLMNGSKENISAQMGDRHKVRSFYNNMLVPYSPHGDSTVDTHAIAAANLFPYASSDKMVDVGLGGAGPRNAETGLRGLYPFYDEAYKRAAMERQILPREMQSITWEGVKGLFPQAEKAGSAYREKIETPWLEYQNGSRTLPQAQQEIIRAAGGFRPPTWWSAVRPGEPGAGAARAPADAGELARPELLGQPSVGP